MILADRQEKSKERFGVNGGTAIPLRVNPGEILTKNELASFFLDTKVTRNSK